MLDAKKAIKHIMLEEGIKVNELADRLDMNPQILSNWLYRSDSPKVSKLEEILGALGYHLEIVKDSKSD